MREVIATITREIVSGLSLSDTEDYCRQVIAQAMEEEDKAFTDEQIEDIIDPIVRDEALIDVDSLDDGDEITDYDWNNLEEDQKVVDKAGNKFVVTSGKVIKNVTVIPSRATAVIAQRIYSDIEHGAKNYMLTANLDAFDFDSLFKKAEESVACPFCGSYNNDVVWVDNTDNIHYCHDCGENFNAPVDIEDRSIEQLTEETYTIVEDVEDIDGTIFFDSDDQQYVLEITRGDDLIDRKNFEDPEEGFSMMDNFFNAYNDMQEGEILRSTETGNEMVIDSIDGDIVEINGKHASRAKIAASKVSGKLLTDRSNVYRLAINRGDTFRNEIGDVLTIIAKANGIYTYEELYTDKTACAVREYQGQCDKKELMKMLINAGYLE